MDNNTNTNNEAEVEPGMYVCMYFVVFTAIAQILLKCIGSSFLIL